MSLEDTLAIAVSKSKEYQEMLEEAQAWKILVEAVADNRMQFSEIIMDAAKAVVASLYIRKLPILLNNRRVCPSFFQWKKYRRSVSNIIFHLAKEDCHNCLNPKSSQYIGPVEAEAGTCGEPKFFNLNGVNKVDYYPPENCRPDPHTPLDIVLDSKTPTGSEELPLPQVVFDAKKMVVSATVDCSSSNACLMLKNHVIVSLYNMQLSSKRKPFIQLKSKALPTKLSQSAVL